mgnify:FL=1
MKNKYKNIAIILVIILAMTLLPGCGKEKKDDSVLDNLPSITQTTKAEVETTTVQTTIEETTTEPIPEVSDDITGFYTMISMTLEGETFTTKDFEEIGMNYYIRAFEDHTMEIYTGAMFEATWEDGVITFEDEDGEFHNDYEMKDDLLTIYDFDEDEGEIIMVYERGEEPENFEELISGQVNGQAFIGEDGSQMVGTYTINAEWIPFEESIVVDDIFDAFLAVSGDSYYVLVDEGVYEYQLENDSFVLKEEMVPTDSGYEQICVDKEGTLYVSGFMRDFVAFKDNTQTFAFKDLDKIAMHPSGEWGISWFYGADVEKVTIGDGTIEKEEMTFSELSSVGSIDINENHMFVSGYSSENDQVAICVYDLENNLELILGDKEWREDDSLGSITSVIETANGFMALDGNMRDLFFWKTDGTFIGTLYAEDLMGTHYPWLSTAVLMPDDSILVGMTLERDDESADEFIVYRITGF